MKRLARAARPDRADVMRAAGLHYKLAPALLEKDFWVCWVLERLFSLPEIAPHLLFKGGTTLSKVYGVIDRFSEDVDISVSREFLRPGAADVAEADTISNTRRRKEIETLVVTFHRAVADVIQPRLREAITSELGTDAGWRLVADERDAGTLHFVYPVGVEGDAAAAYNAPSVKIEMGGRSDVWPAEDGFVTPYAASALPEVFEDPQVPVRVLAAGRTFWEKATLLHNEFHRPAEKRRAERISRHHYDLTRLFRHPAIGPNSLAARDLLDRVIEHKTTYYADSWSRYAEAGTGAMRLVPPDAEIPRLRGDYAQMRPIFLSEPPSFDTILSGLAELEAHINAVTG